jgi:hypothetical protein
MDLTSFPDLSADFNATFWNLEAMGMGGGSNFFDPMSSYFVPFNVEPPNMMGGDDGVFSNQSMDYGFGLGQGQNVDLNMLDGVQVGARTQRRGTGTGMEMEGLDGFDGNG